MKKFLLIPLLVALLVSCTKENTTKKNAGAQEKKAIKVSIADFLMKEENLKSVNGRSAVSPLGRSADLPAPLSQVYYLAYASDGSKVSYIHQDTINNSNTFGTISDSLAPGNYSIVLIASEKPLYTEIFASPLNSNNINDHYFRAETEGAMLMNSIGDIFYKKVQVSISETGNISNLDVTLDRIVGMLEINVLDALPASNENGAINVAISGLTVDFYLGTSAPGAPNNWMAYRGTRLDQHTYREFLMGSNNPFTVTINYKDKTTGADLVKTIPNVKCGANKKTIISGYLYGVPANAGGPDYQVKLNQTWSTDSTLIHF